MRNKYVLTFGKSGRRIIAATHWQRPTDTGPLKCNVDTSFHRSMNITKYGRSIHGSWFRWWFYYSSIRLDVSEISCSLRWALGLWNAMNWLLSSGGHTTWHLNMIDAVNSREICLIGFVIVSVCLPSSYMIDPRWPMLWRRERSLLLVILCPLMRSMIHCYVV